MDKSVARPRGPVFQKGLYCVYGSRRTADVGGWARGWRLKTRIRAGCEQDGECQGNCLVDVETGTIVPEHISGPFNWLKCIRASGPDAAGRMFWNSQCLFNVSLAWMLGLKPTCDIDDLIVKVNGLLHLIIKPKNENSDSIYSLSYYFKSNPCCFFIIATTSVKGQNGQKEKSYNRFGCNKCENLCRQWRQTCLNISLLSSFLNHL